MHQIPPPYYFKTFRSIKNYREYKILQEMISIICGTNNLCAMKIYQSTLNILLVVIAINVIQ